MTSAVDLRLLADVNISPVTVKALQEADWDIVRVTDDLPADTPDLTILKHARRTGRTIVTQDLDFSDLLVLEERDQPSLVTVRISDPSPEVITRRLLAVLPKIQEDLEEGVAVTINDQSTRIRTLPIS